MTTLTTLSTALLATIAALRINGNSWNQVAQTMSMDERELRTQLHEQREDYQRELACAKQDLLDEIYCESIAKLRQTMKCGNAKEEASAAKTLLRSCEMQNRLNAQAAKKAPSAKPTTEATFNTPVPKPAPPQPAPLVTVPVVATAPAPTATPVEQPPTTLTPMAMPLPTVTAPTPKPATTPTTPPAPPGTFSPKILNKRTLLKTLRSFFLSGFM